ncbi:MAG: FAD-dependent oxidoreductase [Chloroflexi bacterium]|nr:FAD-dependent oxidoreductase [Chloroflexota bacterium]
MTQPNSSNVLKADVLIIGGGIAALFAGIKAKETNPDLDVLLVDKAYPGASGCSVFAAGVFPAWEPGDEYDAYVREIIEYNSEYLMDQEYVETAVRESYDRYQDLISYGVGFLRDDKGNVKRIPTLSSGYGKCAIFDGGPNMIWKVRAAAKKRGVRMMDRIVITELLTENGRCVGAVGFHGREGGFYTFAAKATVLAAGTMYSNRGQMGSSGAVGDGPALAYRAGVEMRNMEQIGYASIGPRGFGGIPGLHVIFGHGGKLVNAKGERFMERYNPTLKEESRRSETGRAILIEWREGRGPCYLDCTQLPTESIDNIKKALPLMTRKLATRGLDLAHDKLEFVVMPFGLLHMGGARLRNANGEVNLEGLWVAGTAGDYCGGADATAVTALPGSSVQGARAGMRAAEFVAQATAPEIDEAVVQRFREEALAPLNRPVLKEFEPDRAIQRILDTALRHINILKSESGLKKALAEFEELAKMQSEVGAADPHELKKAHDARNMLQVLELAAKASLMRTESRQSHYRLDYPERDNVNWLKWIIMQRDEDKPRIWTEDVPVHKWKYRPDQSRDNGQGVK